MFCCLRLQQSVTPIIPLPAPIIHHPASPHFHTYCNYRIHRPKNSIFSSKNKTFEPENLKLKKAQEIKKGVASSVPVSYYKSEMPFPIT